MLQRTAQFGGMARSLPCLPTLHQTALCSRSLAQQAQMQQQQQHGHAALRRPMQLRAYAGERACAINGYVQCPPAWGISRSKNVVTGDVAIAVDARCE